MPAHLRSAALPRFVLLYGAIYAAFGVASPFFPAFLGSRGLTAGELGITLAVGTALRLVAAPVAARLGDVLQAQRLVLVVSAAFAALITLGLLPASGFWPLFVLGSFHAAVLAPITVLSDALAIVQARPAPGNQGFEYGWVRGTGSAAFVTAMLIAGYAVNELGLTVIITLQTALLVVTAVSAAVVPRSYRDHREPPHEGHRRAGAADLAALLRCPPFRTLVLAAALVLGSHAMHDAFAVIRWTGAGIGPRTASVLWSASVLSEVLVFFVVGPAMLARLGPAAGILLAATAGVVRWAVLALTPRVFLLALVEPLHGFTFALFHLSAMRLLTRIAPRRLQATALALYGTLGVGASTALLTLASGGLYARIGAHGFWVMASLAASAIPLTSRLRDQRLRQVAALA